MKPLIKKTIVLINEDNYLVYIGAWLFKVKGTEFEREKEYLKEFVEQYWNTYHKKPSSLTPKKIDVMKEVFGLENLEVI